MIIDKKRKKHEMSRSLVLYFGFKFSSKWTEGWGRFDSTIYNLRQNISGLSVIEFDSRYPLSPTYQCCSVVRL